MEGQQQETQPQPQPQPKENGSAQEASSTTHDDEVVTKRALRLQTWRKIQEAKCGINQRAIFNRIPNFIGSDKAAALLADTQEFKNAKNIKVNIDKSQDGVKLEALNTGKNLYLPPARDSQFLYTKVECPADADENLRKKILQIVNWKEHKKDIGLEDKVKLDMVVIGSVIVSRDGYRIGRGNGFVDLDIGILIHLGVITPETLIVTTVHDLQVTDKLPINLFEKHDTPVDLIVTPSEVIRVTNRLPRPQGIFWELLSERRLKIVPILQLIKADEESKGKVIVLKSEDTDIETNGQFRQRQRRRTNFRYRYRRTRSEVNNANEDKERPQRRRRFFNRRRRQTKSEGEQSSGENKENEQNQNRTMKKKRNNREFCIKVSKIAREVRVKDLKAELRKRDCNPVYISWKGGFGKCYLHFANRKGAEKEVEIEKVLKSLHDLSLTVEHGDNSRTINLEVELLKIKDDDTIEAVNTTTV